MTKQPIINIELPAKHLEIRMVRAAETYLFGSRGSFKTSRGCALFCIDMIHEMPRSTGVSVNLSYEHFEQNTLDPLLRGFSDLGFNADEHYVIGKKPPDHWPKPLDYRGNETYTRSISWNNGSVIKIVSLMRKAGANAISAQWGMFDESKFLHPDKLKEIFPIFRGNDDHFKDSSCYLNKFFATDKLADPAEIDWLLQKRKLVDYNKVEDIIVVQNKVNELLQEQRDATETRKKVIQRDIDRLNKILTEERSDMVYVAEINCYEALPILGIKWLKSAKRTAKSQHVWDVAYENKDPDKPGEAFYPAFDENIHGYDTFSDEDILYDEPFIIAADYQHSVAPIPITQISRLPGNFEVSLNYIDYIYALYPEGLNHAVNKLCKKYKHHRTKRVIYVYDHTAIGKRQNADEFCVIVKKAFEDNNWNVEEVYTGQAPGHYQKYTDTNFWLEHKLNEQDQDDTVDIEALKREHLEMQIRIHRKRCANLIKSISGSPAKSSNGKTEKDKKYENTTKYPDLDQSTTTHGSDAFDMINDAVIKQKLVKLGESVASFGIR